MDDTTLMVRLIIFIFGLTASSLGQQQDVIFTAEPCGPGDGQGRGAFAPVPNDHYHYKQCGPAGFYWILPCAPMTFYDHDAQACVPRGGGGGGPKVDQEELPSPLVFNKSEHFNLAFLSEGNSGGGTQAPTAKTIQEITMPAKSMTKAPVRIIIENHHKISHQQQQLVAARDKQTSRQQERTDEPQEEREIVAAPLSPPGPLQLGPAPGPQQMGPPPGPGGAGGPQMVYLPYPYPMMPYPPGHGPGPGGQPPPGAIGGPMGHSGHGGNGPQGPPAFFLMPPPPPPRATVEPEPPRLSTLVEECVENGTCANEEETAADAFCLHQDDPTRYFLCSPHPELAGVWVEQQCPAGLHFSGERCDRPARGGNRGHGHGKPDKPTRPLAPRPAPAPAPPPAPRESYPPPSTPKELVSHVREPPIPVVPPSYVYPPQSEKAEGPLLALPPGAEFVVEPNTTPQPAAAPAPAPGPPPPNPWQYAMVNSAGVVQVPLPAPSASGGPSPYDHRLPGASLTSVGQSNQPKQPWYVRQPHQPLPAPLSMIAPGTKSYEPPVYPTPAPYGPPRYPSPGWGGLYPITTPPTTRWPNGWPKHPSGQAQPPQGPGKGTGYPMPPTFPGGEAPKSPQALTPEQMYALHQQQQQQLSHGSFNVIPAIPGSRVAANQFPSSGPSPHHPISPEYMYPYGRPAPTRPLATTMTDYRPQMPPPPVYPHLRDTTTPLPPPEAQGGEWILPHPSVGQRCSLLVSPKAQIVGDSSNRRAFYMCIPAPGDSAWTSPETSSEGQWALMECPQETLFNPLLKVCDKSPMPIANRSKKQKQ